MRALEGKVALVTGAGQGIGRGIALALSTEGASVAVVGRTRATLDRTVAEIEAREGRAVAVVCDVKVEDQVRDAVDMTVTAFGALDVLVNNAQEYNFGPLLDIPMEMVETGWQSGPLATLRFMRAAHEHLRDGGVVVNVSSSAAVTGDPTGIGVYGATKAAVESISRAAAVEWSGDGIRVNTIMPLARTPALQASFDAYPGLEDQLVAGVPMGRLGDPETDIGAAVAFLAGPDASYITGTTLTVDGGSVRLR